MNDKKGINLWSLVGVVAGVASGFLTAKSALRAIEHLGNEELPNELLDANTVMEGYRRGLIAPGILIDDLKKEGFNEERIEIMKQLTEQLLPLQDLITLRLKGLMDEAEFERRFNMIGFKAESANRMLQAAYANLQPNDMFNAEFRKLEIPKSVGSTELELQSHGWDKPRVDMMRELAKRVPALADLFTFASWDADNPESVRALGLDAEMPDTYLAEAYKNGIPEDMAKRMWRSHWQIPSLFIIKNLYQSGQIADATLDTMLKVFQLPPSFRKQIAAALSKPLSTGQIQAQLEQGLISTDDVKRMLMHSGYKADQVENVAKIIIDKANNTKTAAHKAREAMREKYYGLSIANIMDAYKDKLLTYGQVVDYLHQFGEPTEVVQLHISLAEFEMQQKLVKERLAENKDNYMNGAWDYNQVSADLASMGLPPDVVSHYLDTWTRELKRQVKLPTKSDLDNFVKKGIISIDDYGAQLSAMGYPDFWINAYVAYLEAPKAVKTTPSTP